jgi:hypothetical protein
VPAPPPGGRRGAFASCLCLLAALLAFGQSAGADSADSPPARLRVDGRVFRTADGARFSWRGLTAFRLVEMVAHGRRAEAVGVLDWARSHGVTVVRVLTMTDVLFKLSAAEGRAALPRLLALAAERGLYVEAVALADTDRIAVSLDEQVKAVGAVCAAAPNCLLELANEPWARHTQRAETGDPVRLRALRTLVPRGLPVALGSASSDESDELAAGDYVTVHVAREEGDRGWRSVVRMRVAEALGARTGKPVVDDEPIGAADADAPGRRDADTGTWFARGLLARLLEIGATFHYEGGLQGRVPSGREAACFHAWRRGLDALPPGLEDRVAVRQPGSDGAALRGFDASRAAGLFLAQGDREAWAVAVGVTGDPALRWETGWAAEAPRKEPGVVIVRATSPANR